MKIYTLNEILNTEHLGDERYVRVEEIERLSRENENLNVDYLRERAKGEHLVEVLDKIENIEADVEQLRKIAGEAIKIELTEGQE